MAPMPTPRSLLSHQTPTKTPQSKQRLNFPNPKGGSHPSLINTLSVTPTEHPVEVIGRIRDYPNRKEKPSSSSSALEISGDGRSLRVRTDIGYRDFSLDGVSLSEIEDLEVFYKRFVESRVEGVRSGAKCTIMMYGPTGAGKSHTMFGCARQAGIVYRALRDILGEGERDDGMNDPEFGLTLFVQVAVLEIYNEEIYDLLSGGNPSGAGTGIALPKGSTPKAKLEVMGRKAKNATYICGNEAVKISREVAKVEKRRIVKNTLLNERSSRSHCVIIMDVPAVGGRLMLVDMAGSENIEQAGQAGFEAKMQTAKINQGNIALKRVVESIANGDSHVPFRDSKLTMLLQDSFEDDKSKFLMILCASPDPKEMHKTIATLEYGAKAKCIVRVAHMPTPRDKLGIEDSSSLLRSRIVAMNQFIYKLQMENKFKDKEFDKARSELLRKEEEILQLSSKLELMEGRGAASKEEEFKLRTKLIKMEEKVQQQQEELDFLRKQLEGVESANKESPLHLEKRDDGKFMKRLAEMCAGDQGMVKSMELDMGDQQYIHDVKEIEEDKNHAEIQFNGSQRDSYHPNIVEDGDFDVPRFPEVCLSTVYERDDEGEDRESLEEEVDKEVVDEEVGYNFSLSNHQPENLSNGKESESTRRTRIQNIFRLCGNHRELAQQVKISTPSKSKPEDAHILHSSPSTLGKEIGFKETVEFALPTKPGGTSVSLLTSVYGLDQELKENKEPKGVESADIFRLCGNHRELAQQVKISTPSKSKPEDAHILHSSPSTLGKEIGFKETVEFALPTKPGGTSVSLLTSVYGLDQESKENKEPKGVESADMMDVYVKWEASKELSGKTIRKLKVLKNSTLCDLRKLIETHLEEDNNNQPFTFLLLAEPFGAPVAKEKEAAVLVGKLPICKNELNGYIACLRPTKSTVQRQNHVLPFSSLENTLPLHEMKA